MASSGEKECSIEVVCTALPGAGSNSLQLGIQHGKNIIETQSADLKRIVFKPVLRAQRNADGSVNFLGPFAQGPKAERFIYLNWTETDAKGQAKMVGRIKLHLNHIKWNSVEKAAAKNKPLRVTLRLTNNKGRPVMASVRSDAASWELI